MLDDQERKSQIKEGDEQYKKQIEWLDKLNQAIVTYCDNVLAHIDYTPTRDPFFDIEMPQSVVKLLALLHKGIAMRKLENNKEAIELLSKFIQEHVKQP